MRNCYDYSGVATFNWRGAPTLTVAPMHIYVFSFRSEQICNEDIWLGVGRRVEIVDRRHVRLREAKAQTGDSEKTTNPTRGLFHYALHTGFKGFCDVDEDKAARNVEWQDRKVVKDNNYIGALVRRFDFYLFQKGTLMDSCRGQSGTLNTN
jgi:hypothetical protein